MLGDLKNKPFIIAKGLLFLLIGILTSAALILESRSWKTAVVLAICIWSFCRFYYFAFYVIQKYVDGGFRFTGLLDVLRYMLTKRPSGGSD